MDGWTDEGSVCWLIKGEMKGWMDEGDVVRVSQLMGELITVRMGG